MARAILCEASSIISSPSMTAPRASSPRTFSTNRTLLAGTARHDRRTR
jgi:hypothetical protein